MHFRNELYIQKNNCYKINPALVFPLISVLTNDMYSYLKWYFLCIKQLKLFTICVDLWYYQGLAEFITLFYWGRRDQGDHIF